jgi:hypothetical protein
MKFSGELINKLKVLRNMPVTKDQLRNIFVYTKNMKEFLELQVMLNNRYIGYY